MSSPTHANNNRPLHKFIRAVQMVNFMLKNKISSDDLFVLTRVALEKPIRIRSSSILWIIADIDILMVERFIGRLSCGQKIKSKFGPNLFRELCKNLYYFQSDINKTIININHEGKTFFIILRGRVSVNIYLPCPDSLIGDFRQ